MTRDDAVERIKSGLGDRLLDVKQPSGKRLYFRVDQANISEASELLQNDLGARFQTASGLDAPHEMEILYHWAIDPIGLVITVKTSIDRDRPEIASITPVCPAAQWIEREMWELLGIKFQNHPDLRHLLLTNDWPEGQYPLRRDYRKE